MNAAPATVLVIESQPMMREALCFIITQAADLNAVMQAGSVREALQMLEKSIPDIVLLTVDRVDDGEMNALAALHKWFPATPILALTSNEVPGQEQAALANGAQLVLTKAAPHKELIQALQTLRPQPTQIENRSK